MKPLLGLFAILAIGFSVSACNNSATEEKKAEGDTAAKKTESVAPANQTIDTTGKKDTLDPKPTETGN